MFIIEDNTQDYGGMNFIGRRRRRSRRRSTIRRKKGRTIDKRQKTNMMVAKGQDGLNNHEAQTTEATNQRKYKEGDSKIDISKKKENNKTDSRKDKGWAWVIVAGIFFSI
jgi:hypothetical protein